jgi:hypothetical protein|tara:strand:- start:288 stop:683 length:396 start_codon:yes stop_codon:yes gene_type:complete
MVYEITPSNLRKEGDTANPNGPAPKKPELAEFVDDADEVPKDTRVTVGQPDAQPKGRRRKKQAKQLSAYHRDELLAELWRRLEKKKVDQDVDMGDGRKLKMEPKHVIIVRNGSAYEAKMVYIVQVETEVEL